MINARREYRAIGMLYHILIVVSLCPAILFGQRPEFDFFPDYRNVFTLQVRAENPSLTNDGIVEKYSMKLRAEGTAEEEITRRAGERLLGQVLHQFSVGIQPGAQRLSNGDRQGTPSRNRSRLCHGRRQERYLFGETRLESLGIRSRRRGSRARSETGKRARANLDNRGSPRQ